MLSVSEIKAIKYAIKAHYKGLQLLRNPKGTPGTVVRTLDYGDCMDPLSLDIWQRTTRTTVDFSKPENPVTTENFTVNIYNFFNSENKKVNSLKGVEYSRINPDGSCIRKEKCNIDRKYLEARVLTNLHTPSITRIEMLPELYSNDTFNGYRYFAPVEVKKSFAQIQLEQFKNKSDLKYFESTSHGKFWRTLWHNIRQK